MAITLPPNDTIAFIDICVNLKTRIGDLGSIPQIRLINLEQFASVFTSAAESPSFNCLGRWWDCHTVPYIGSHGLTSTVVDAGNSSCFPCDQSNGLSLKASLYLLSLSATTKQWSHPVTDELCLLHWRDAISQWLSKIAEFWQVKCSQTRIQSEMPQQRWRNALEFPPSPLPFRQKT